MSAGNAFAVIRHRFRLRSAAAIGMIAALVYGNAVLNGFVLDDKGVILGNPLVKSVSGLWRAFANPYGPPSVPLGQYRPVVIASFTLDWLLAPNNPLWFHAENVLWHVLATILVWRLASACLSPVGALAAGLLFAVHSVHVEAVANTVGRAECMATVFVIAALLLHRRSPVVASELGDGHDTPARGPHAWWRWAPLLFGLGLASKENAIVFLALAFFNDVLLEGDARAAVRARRGLYAGYGAVIAAYAMALLLVFRHRHFVIVAAALQRASIHDRLLTAMAVVPHDVRLLVWPMRMSSDYSPIVIELAQRTTPAVVLGMLLIVAGIAAVALSARRAPSLAFALLWVAAAIAPVSNVFFASGIVLAERTLYLPSVGAVIAIGLLAEWSARRRPAMTLVVGGFLLLAMAGRTWTRTATWRDSRAWLGALLSEHPESYKAHEYLAQLFAAMGRWPEADAEFTRARRIFGGDAYLYNSASGVASHQGDLPRAIALLDTAVALDPTIGAAQLARAAGLLQVHRDAEAVASARLALPLLGDRSDRTTASLIEGLALQRLGAVQQSRAVLDSAIVVNRTAWQLHAALASVLAQLGDSAAARQEIGVGERLRRVAGADSTRTSPASPTTGNLQR